MSRSDWQDAFGDMGLRQEAQLTRLALTILDPWVDKDGNPQPFRAYSPEKLQELADNIRVNGVIEPIRVRPRNGRFQIIAGHNRVIAAGMAGLTTIPAIVEDVDDAQAAILLVDSNLQHREKMLPSEKAFAYKLRLDSIGKKKVGRPSKRGQDVPFSENETSPGKRGQVVPFSQSGKWQDIIAEQTGDNAKQIKRYIRLTELIPSLLDRVDAGTLGMTVGVDLSYLSQEAQAMLVRIMEEHGIKKIRGSQSAELKAAGPNPSEETILQVLGIFGDEKDSFPSLTIKPDFSNCSPSIVKRLKKDNAYIEGLQIAIQQFTDRYIQDFEKEATT